MEEEIRFPSVSGKFYPIDPGELSNSIKELLAVKPVSDNIKGTLKALILPYSGYQFCGEIMAAGYNQIQNQVIDEVFILGFSHYHEVDKTAFGNFKYWQTPLGKVEQSHRVNQIVMSDDASAKDLLRFDNDKHHGEHTIEVQLPFLQEVVSGEFRIIPMLCGEISPRLLSRALDKHLDPDDLFIVPAELSHGYPDDYAREIDNLVISNILQMNSDFIEGDKCEASNETSISTLIHLARIRGWKPKLLGYMTSAEKTGDTEKVSGYVAIGFFS